MRSSIVLLSLLGALAMAFPFGNLLEKKAIVTDIVIETVYVTVTAGRHLPTSSSKGPVTHTVQHTVVVNYTPPAVPSTSSSSSIAPPPPPPPPSSTYSAVPLPPTTTAPPAPPPTTAAPAPAPIEPTTVAAPVVSTQAAPVVQSAAAPSDYVSTAIYHHNMHRANHSASDVTWDDQLAKNALATANTCVFAHDMTENGGGYGQNLAAYGTTEDLSKFDLSNLVADAITNEWYYGEAANVIYGVDSPAINGPEFLHFTQVVWKASTKIGCATVKCPAGSIFGMGSLYTVCDYASQGNVLGEFISQVSKPINLAAISASIN